MFSVRTFYFSSEKDLILGPQINGYGHHPGVQHYQSGWYWCDETRIKYFGPYPTQKLCRADFEDFLNTLLEG